MRQGTLFAQRFDATREELAGDPVLVADSVALYSSRSDGGFSVSETGMLAYRKGGGAGLRRLAWFDRSGKEVGAVGGPDDNDLQDPRLSPDGRRVAVDRTVQGNMDVWLIDAARGVPSRFTFDAARDFMSSWSPDGSRIAFASSRKVSSTYIRRPPVAPGVTNCSCSRL